MSSLKELRQVRLDKLAELKKLGIDCFPSKSSKNINNKDVRDQFSELENKKVFVAGRIISFRKHGKIAFCDIADFSGVLQLYIKEDTLFKTDKTQNTIGFENLELLDIGDFVEAYGTVTKTQRGEISVLVEKLKLLTKSLRPLPEKHEGLKDPETIFRRRYLDFAVNPERREVFLRKSVFWDENRKFLKGKGFIELETPILELVTGGADAKPFMTHHNALDQDFYLRISSELFQKRLIGGGFEKVFVLGPNFRNEGIDDEHLQEYYQCEWYWAYANFRDNMNLVREMFTHLAKSVWGKTKFEKNGHTFDLDTVWEEIDYSKTIQEKFKIDVFKSQDEEIIKALKAHKVVLSGPLNRMRLMDALWKVVRREIAGPAFLINEPKFMSPLAKSSAKNPNITERFHIILAGSELGNGYSELNDPLDQLERFKDQQKQRDAGDDEAQMLDIDYVEMLEYGMPPVSGYAHSERLFWFLEGVTAREGTLFPQMKHKIEETTKEIYHL